MTHPLDVVRTKLAVARWRSTNGCVSPQYRGTFNTLRTIVRDEGVRGLYRGLTPALVVNAPAAATFFGTYKFVSEAYGCPTGHPSGVGASLGAGAGWLATCLIFNPLYVLKTKQQTQLVRPQAGAPLKYVGLISSLRVVLREQGWRGLYVGTMAACAGAPGAMIQMPLYESLKGDNPSTVRVAASSASSSAVVGLLAYPLDVVRMRLQAQGPRGASEEHYAGIVDTFRKMYHSEGLGSFYRGFATALIRSVPQTAIALVSFETILRFADSMLLPSTIN